MRPLRRLRDGLSRNFRTDIYARLLPYVRPYWLPMVAVMVFQLASTALGLLEPWTMKILIDNGLSGHALPSWLGRVLGFLGLDSRTGIIVVAVFGALVLRLSGNALDIGGTFVKSHVNGAMRLRFRADMFNHLQRLSFSYHDRTTVGDSIYRLNNDTGFVTTLIWSNLRHLITSAVTLVAILWIVVQLDWQLALLALAIAPVEYLSVGFYSRFFKAKSKRARALESMAQTIIQEVLSCLRVVKAFGQEEREQRRFESQSWTALRARVRLDLEQSLFSAGLRFFSKLDRSLILLLGALHVLEGRLTIGELLVILSYVGQLHEPIEGIADVLTDMQNSLVSAERAVEVLDVRPEVRDRPCAKSLDRVEGAVGFENVTFAYFGTHIALRDASLTVRPGEIVALVGPTGAGKTTLASLVARFYEPTSGRVTLDGNDIRDLTIRTLRDNIALVLQEPILFSGTIRENIAYGRPGARMDEIEAAARAANCHDFILALPDGYESEVGERGVRLSGGERQRICLARAFLKNAPVLILDEPTSSLDSRTERAILDPVDRLMVGRTTFIIAHRPSTINRAGRIVVMDKGRIVEQGTHAELLSGNGLYAELYRLQAGALERTEPLWSAGRAGVEDRE